MSHILKAKSKPRDPLQHPSGSPVSPLGASGPGARPPSSSASPFTSKSAGGRKGGAGGEGTANNAPTTTPQAGSSRPSTGAAPGGLNFNLSVPVPVPSVPSFHSRESTRTTTDRTDALWAEMQATLEAVELSAGGTTTTTTASAAAAAATGSARVFGPDHERKLDELRAAQIALAQAWARSEADEAIETTAGAGAGCGSVAGGKAGEVGAGVSEGRRSVVTDAGGGGAGGRSTVGTGSAARPGSSGLGMAGAGGGGQGGEMEEETEADILLARKRREANDRYFQRVSQGVLDVVAKLEDVAIAMRAVEQESKELWGDEDESIQQSAKT
ncbi:hypothetical protein MYCTH_2311813 [Thermothelomyces thermophilus ATCC 42464]|uniref:Uncharacterized protein n=1 Tax=Thermothelomyces thermophilus (strain ATCC 42464 / BCRC 31852 / DSM 1799) TaxID=573729 RepID=G2QPP0_THET4|nr:uncharacterized protein MYCTH_2311813 [Thermothelomyces thermophilus ATCC 42464]AEO61553.1 hypothetical protein MYCTH_2311813 [Thermothelomyces thermophilus ATCC 42464]